MILMKAIDAKILTLVLLALFSRFLQAGIEAIPELAYPGLFLGQSMDQFIREHPDAVISGQRKGAEQYWLRREDGSLMLVAFRSGEVVMLSLAIKSLSHDEQTNKTRSWVSELTKRYGDPQWTSAGKMVKGGVVHAATLIYDLGGGISVVLQSTELELSLTLADFGRIEFGRVVVSYNELKKKSPEAEQTEKRPDFKDYLKSLIEASTRDKLKFPDDGQPGPVKLHLSLKGDAISQPRQASPATPTHAIVSTRLWLLLPVFGLTATGLLYLLLKCRK